MPALVVVGAQWGDEGKGKIVHYLARRTDFVVRYQGGNNAGHTVVEGKKRFALHLMPSGILLPRVKNVIGNGVVVNPRAFREEVEGLEKSGIHVRGRIFVSLLAHVILPYHVLLDTLREEGGRGIGTTKKGIGPCYEDKVARIGIRLCDYLEPKIFRELVRQNLRVRASELSRVKPVEAILADVMREYESLRRFMKPFCCDASALLSDAFKRGKKVLVESAQGAMLDLDFGTYPFVTSSNPLAGAASIGAGIPPFELSEILGVTKAYTTRVGLGPFPTEIEGKMATYLREVGGEYGTTTGRPRRIGWLDLPQLRWAIRTGGITSLVMTKLDTLSGVDPIKVCVAYRLGSRILKEFPVSRSAQSGVKPVYESFPGFSGDISGVRRFENLPAPARRYVQEIEKRLGRPIVIVSLGRSREQTIERGKI
jgi:adenylosuccinate synthase